MDSRGISSRAAHDVSADRTSSEREVHAVPRPRFLQLSDVCETLDISASQTYALVRSGELPAIKIGGRGQWRVELSQLEAFIQRMYDQTHLFVATHPFGQADGSAEDEEEPPGAPSEVLSDTG